MKIRDQLKYIETAFAPWVKNNGAVFSIASDTYDLCTLLAQSAKSLRVVVLFEGEDKRGDFEECGFVDRKFWVIASRGSGLALKSGTNLLDGVAGGRPLYELIEELREQLRALTFDTATTEVTPDYKGCEPFSFEGYLTDAMKLTFTIGTQLPAVS